MAALLSTSTPGSNRVNPLERLNEEASKAIYFTLAPGQTRVVKLSCGQRTDPISCQITVVLLEDESDWEDTDESEAETAADSTPVNELKPMKRHEMKNLPPSDSEPRLYFEPELDSKPLEVSRYEALSIPNHANLEQALKHLRSATQDRALWIDALCINQSDPQERNWQVRQMHKIYAAASRVLIWPGPADDTSDAAMHFIQDFEAQGRDRVWLVNDKNIAEHAYAVTKLYRRDYWSRVWVQQESAFAQKILLICGSLSVQYNENLLFLCDGFRHSDYITRLTEVLADRGRPLEASFYENFYIREGHERVMSHNRDLHSVEGLANNLVDYAWGRKCSDPRDAVFGLFNLFPPQIQTRINVDYNLTAPDVLISATQAFIEASKSLNIISWPTAMPNQSSGIMHELQLPSWIFTLAYSDGARPLFWLYTTKCLENPFACVLGTVLHVRGIRHGLVKHVQRASFLHYGGDIPSTMLNAEEMWRYLEICWLLLNSKDIDTEGKMDCFLRTMAVHTVQALYIEDLFRERLNTLNDLTESTVSLPGSLLSKDALYWLCSVRQTLAHRSFFLFDAIGWADGLEYDFSSQFGIASSLTQVGDILCLLKGCSIPVILRPVSDGQYVIIGDTYVDELFTETAARYLEPDFEDLEEEDFFIR